MAQFDGSPLLNIQPVDPMGAYARALQLRQLVQQNQLGLAHARLYDAEAQKNALALQELQQKQADEQAVRNAAPKAMVPQQGTINTGGVSVGGVTIPGRNVTVQGPAQFDRGAMLNELGKSAPHLVPQMQQQFAKQDMDQQKMLLDLREKLAKIDETTLGNIQKQNGLVGSMLGSVMQADPQNRPAVYGAAWQHANAIGLDPAKHGLPPQYSPQLDPFLTQYAQQAMTVEQMVTAEQQRRNAEETKRHNKTTEGLTAEGHQITIRGQNMTDARSREQNQISRDTKLEMNRAADDNQLVGFNASMDRLIAAAKELKDHPGLPGITGIPGKFPDVPGGAAANARAKLGTLKSQTAFTVLQDMRNNSKTGGALGQVSDKEGQLLQDNLAALDTAQSTDEYRKALDKIITYGDAAKQRAADAVQRKYSWQKQNPAQALQQPTQSQPAMYAVNPQTKQRIVSNDGGKTWQAAQ